MVSSARVKIPRTWGPLICFSSLFFEKTRVQDISFNSYVQSPIQPFVLLCVAIKHECNELNCDDIVSSFFCCCCTYHLLGEEGDGPGMTEILHDGHATDLAFCKFENHESCLCLCAFIFPQLTPPAGPLTLHVKLAFRTRVVVAAAAAAAAAGGIIVCGRWWWC